MTGHPLVAVADLGVSYGATRALDGVGLEVRPGEVHAVVGENGAGKSTLLRAIAGALQPAAGTIRLTAGARCAWVPQETPLPPDLTAAEWIFLGRELRGRLGWLRRLPMRAAARGALDAVGCAAAVDLPLRRLPAPQRKQVQLARALREPPDVLLLDEPTAVLGEAETRVLFRVVRALAQRGGGVLYVSHRLEEVLGIADRVTVLRDGRHVSTDPVRAVDTGMLVQRMVGRDIRTPRRTERALGAPVLRVENLAAAHVRGVSLTLCGGEVVGLAGLVGAGRSEILEAVAGLQPLRGGRIECAVRPALVPEDRAGKGLVPTLGVRENIFLPADGWLLRRRRERGELTRWIQRLSIRTPDAEAPPAALSGGNQQKLLLARALRHRPRLLLLDEPTAGIDVGAKAEIHALIRELASAGTGVLLASSDLPELLTLCDRIVAMRGGVVAGAVAASTASEAVVAALITGAGPL